MWIVDVTHSPEVLVSHANARLNVHARRLLVDRVRHQGWAVAHAAKAMGISRQCAHRWVSRFDAEGEAGLADKSSPPHSSPHQTPAPVEEAVLAVRVEHRRGQDWIGPELGLPPRTVSRTCAATTRRTCARWTRSPGRRSAPARPPRPLQT